MTRENQTYRNGQTQIPELSVLIATYMPEGIVRVANMDAPRVEGVHYWVSWQTHCDAPIPEELSAREDFTILRFDRIGQSANRNNLFENASGKIFLISDDDLTYSPEGLRAIIEAFAKRQEMDVATFKYEGGDNKSYPTAECDIRKYPKGYYVTGFEIAIRNSSRTSKLRFDEHFGINASVLGAGEDEMLLFDARQMGLNCRFIPITIASHPSLTTGSREIKNPATSKAIGAYIAIAFPASAILRIPLKAYRLWRNNQRGFFRALTEMIQGAIYAWRTPQLRARIIKQKDYYQ